MDCPNCTDSVEPAKGYWVTGHCSKEAKLFLHTHTKTNNGPFNIILDEGLYGGKIEWISLDPRYPSMKYQTAKPSWFARIISYLRGGVKC